MLQPDGGFLAPERCVVAHVNGALANGAVVRTGERVLEWEDTRGRQCGFERTAATVEAERLVLTAGAWSVDVARLPPGLVRRAAAGPRVARADRARPLRARAVPGLQRRARRGAPVRLPGPRRPRVQGRASTTTTVQVADPDSISREPTPARRGTRAPVRGALLPATARARRWTLKACLFELSPDEHFLIDRHPETELAVFGAGFSGHGFKFCSVVGEILADLVLDGQTAPRHRVPSVEPLRLVPFGWALSFAWRGRGGTGRRGGFRSRWAARPLEVRVLPPASGRVLVGARLPAPTEAPSVSVAADEQPDRLAHRLRDEPEQQDDRQHGACSSTSPVAVRISSALKLPRTRKAVERGRRV